MNGLLIFGRVTLAVGVLLLIVFVYLFLSWVSPEMTNPLAGSTDKVQALTAILGLFFGSAASIGGAVATLQLASLGLEISKSQELRDHTAFLDEKASNTIKLYSNLLVAIGNVYSSGVILDLKIPHLEKEGLLNRFEEKVPEELNFEMLHLSEKLLQLVESLNEILKDEFSHHCFQQSALQFQGKLDHISNGLIALGMQLNEVNVPISNLSDIAALLEVASRRIDDGKLGGLMQARLCANSAHIALFNIPYNNINVRSFFFMGNLIFVRSEMTSPSKKMFIASYGAAILHDLIKIVPGGAIISKTLSQRYSSLNNQENNHLVYFEPQYVISRNLLLALEESEKIGDLYLLVAEESEEKVSTRYKKPDLLIQQLHYLKTLGIDDPEIDMFIAIINGDELLLKSALERGANPNLTDIVLTIRYEKQLAGFQRQD